MGIGWSTSTPSCCSRAGCTRTATLKSGRHIALRDTTGHLAREVDAEPETRDAIDSPGCCGACGGRRVDAWREKTALTDLEAMRAKWWGADLGWTRLEEGPQRGQGQVTRRHPQ